MPETWSVGKLNRYVRQALEKDFRLQGVRVAGEVSGFKIYPSGHWYFTLKDAEAQVNCVMWRTRAEAQRGRYLPREGEAVEAQGQVTLYEARGQFQLEVTWLAPAGAGELYQRFAQLKAQLEAEGLFAPERKRPLPVWPRRIGLVTSPAGAALRDMVNILRRRFPVAEVVLAPTAVQGAEAPPQIVAALQAVATCKPTVVIVARGGGALEDLWAFNDERVVRAIAACPVPVVSGIGHETDFTLADFAADVRAPTPSAAAELVTPDRQQLQAQAGELAGRAAQALARLAQTKRWAWERQTAQLQGLSPQALLRNSRQRLDDLQARGQAALQQRLRLERERHARWTQALHGVSPLAVLARGYAVVRHRTGGVVRRVAEVQAGEHLTVRVADGEFGVTPEA